MDALSYTRAHVFTANMTGNAVLLGLAAAGPERSKAFNSLLAIAAFAVGGLIGAVVLVRMRHLDPVHDLRLGCGLEAPFAILFTVLWCAFPNAGAWWLGCAMIASAACALGIQSVAVRRLQISGVFTTFITGTIITAIVSLLERREPGVAPEKQHADSPPLLLLTMLLLYVVAAFTGGLLAKTHSRVAALDALAPLLAVWIHSWARQRHAIGG